MPTCAPLLAMLFEKQVGWRAPVSRLSQWKKIFGLSKKPKVTVQVGEKAEVMTETQAFRFDELAQTGSRATATLSDNPLEQSRYSLQDAAFRLMISEAELLRQAASGSIRLYADVTGLEGRWRRIDANGKTIESSMRSLRSGYLGLPIHLCKELALQGGINVSTFELPDLQDSSKLELDIETMRELSAWGDEKKVFFLREPILLDHGGIVLMAPLATGNPDE